MVYPDCHVTIISSRRVAQRSGAYGYNFDVGARLQFQWRDGGYEVTGDDTTIERSLIFYNVDGLCRYWLVAFALMGACDILGEVDPDTNSVRFSDCLVQC